jgi:alanyl-tRNA synthetase
MAAREHLEHQQSRLKEISETLKVPPSKAAERVKTLVAERKALERELADAKKKLAMGGGNTGENNAAKKLATPHGEISFMGRVVEDIAVRELKGLVDEGKKAIGSGVVVICAKAPDGKAGIVVGVTGDLVDQFNAVDLVRIGSTVVGGKGGGGRPDMAQAGGPDADKATDALAAIEAAIAG